jgi:dienelactone hydrolase
VRVRLSGPLAFVVAAALCSGCVDHNLAHPRTAPVGVHEWSDSAVRGKLLVRLEWAAPAGEGRLPTVIVHPEAGHEAVEMRGILRDLAAHGYLAVAADYRRAIGGRYRETLFTWRDQQDVRAVFDLVGASPLVDPARIGLLGFSQGGVYSLSIAAQTGNAAAVVAYYPVTDFEQWLEESASGPGRRWVFRLIRRHFFRQSGAKTDDEFRELLARASPLRQAEHIRCPVLLIHGDRDKSAGVEQSRRLAARLRELGTPVELLEVPGAGHVFNFRDEAQAELAWAATLRWLDSYTADHAKRLDAPRSPAPVPEASRPLARGLVGCCRGDGAIDRDGAAARHPSRRHRPHG